MNMNALDDFQYETAYDQKLVMMRYAILQRLAPSLRHKTAGKLQPLSILSQLLIRKIQIGEKDTEFLLKWLEELNIAARVASFEFQNLFSWISIDTKASKPLNEVVAECLELLNMELYNNTLSVVNSIEDAEPTNIANTRTLFIACMLTLIDTQLTPTIATLSSRHTKDSMQINIQLSPDKVNETKALIGEQRFKNWDNIRSLLDPKTMTLSVAANEVVISGL